MQINTLTLFKIETLISPFFKKMFHKLLLGFELFALSFIIFVMAIKPIRM